MKICIKKNELNKTLLSQPWCDENKALEMGYKIIELEEKYKDCCLEDFNEDLTFNPVKYQTRKTIEITKQKIEEYKQKLRETNDKVIEYAEGLISETDYAPIKVERENYRRAINSLEISLK